MRTKYLFGKAIAIMLALSLSIPGVLFSQVRALAPVAQLAEVVGSVTITRNGKQMVGTKEMKIYIGDDIKTEASAEAAVKYSDGSILFVREKSNISIQPLPGKPTVGRRIKIMVGRVWARIRPSKAYETEIETPAAVAAIRGTDIEVEVVTGSAWRIVRIGCADGKLELVFEEDGVMQTIILEEGKMAVFQIGEKMFLIGFTIGSIAGSGLLTLGAKIIPFLIAGGLGGAATGYLVIKELTGSPAKP